MHRSDHEQAGYRTHGRQTPPVSELMEGAADAGRLRRFAAIEHFLPVTLPYASSTYALDAGDEIPSQVETLVPLGDPRHYRVNPAKSWAVGYSEFCGLADGLFVQLARTTFAAPCATSMAAPNMLRVRIASDGDYEYATPDGQRIDIRGAGASIIIEPPGMAPAEAAFRGRNDGVTIVVHRNILKRLYAQGTEELPAEVQDFIAGNLRRSVARRLPLVRGLQRCLEDMYACDLEGASRRLFLKSKAIEILCHAFQALAQDERLRQPPTSALTTRSVIEAQRLLTENFVTPPSLEDLAQQVGMSRSNLCLSFRQIAGQTVYDFITDRRMEHALALLQQRETSITQIAYAVGYSHPSSFSMAVQRRFGASPSELRRRSLPVI
ncbi:AraC-like DNA-binding protein [Sphingopyxis panaciterrae]|uniref:helix-turn-helix domain-containing protein n=1 Tax=Sphingopyxis panaciterrae TaxID=363841 RepID=UPI001420018A|nr:AraC-like DNA-binding protein [Sphingopyxis panaciterrae]